MQAVRPGFELLSELALDLRSSWNHRADWLWEQIDPELWRETANAWLVLQTVSQARLNALWDLPAFRQRAMELREERERDRARGGWFQQSESSGDLGAVAFFSMEFALSEALPIYSGGLGNVAGDYLKAASDLGVPLVGVGLLYQQGYFRQALDASGAQREHYPFNDTNQLPIVPVRDGEGNWVRVRLPRPGRPVWVRGWQAWAGAVPLYLLDSNDPSNSPADRGITAQLYGGDAEMRLLQEMALGIGGYRLLEAIGRRPSVCHLNEGHAALVVLERAATFMREHGTTFDIALAATRVGNVFTTHTPVEAGFDRFSPELVRGFLGNYARDALGISVEGLLALGRADTRDDAEPLNMAWLATRGAGAINAVSRRHAEVSRRIFQVLFPRWPEAEVPIGYVTNGVHTPSWDSEAADALWTDACGSDRWLGVTTDVAPRVGTCPDDALWALRATSRQTLVDFVRELLPRTLAASGASSDAVDEASHVLDADTLTIGLARRFTSYKRPTLLLRDPARLVRLLTDPRRPVQVVVAGKAHPRDDPGKALVKAWVDFARRPEVRRHVVFLADYDLRLAERLVQGVDLWINTPRPPWEACGTSGMKVLVNGGLNLSSLDGWWAEAFRPDAGWAIEGDGRDDDADARRLCELLESEVVPAFYERDESGLPPRWVARMRASMSVLAPHFSANRALREYTEDYYVPAAQAFARRAAGDGQRARVVAASERALSGGFARVRFGDGRVESSGGAHHFTISAYLGELEPDAVAVELYADGLEGAPATRVPLERDGALVGAHGFRYRGSVQDARPAHDYTPRVLPAKGEARVPLELPFVAWAR